MAFCVLLCFVALSFIGEDAEVLFEDGGTLSAVVVDIEEVFDLTPPRASESLQLEALLKCNSKTYLQAQCKLNGAIHDFHGRQVEERIQLVYCK